MDNSAAAMIQRFRNAKPTSREDREKQKEATGVNRLWYESGDQEEVEKPRALVVGPSGQPSRPSSALRNIREPSDYMASPSNSLYQNRKLGASLGLDDMISNEIRQLQAQMEEQDRATNARLNLGSFDPTRSLDRSYDGGPTYRFNARDSRDSLPRRSASPSPMRRSAQLTRNNGLSDSTDEFLRKYQVGSFGADAWRSSTAGGGGGGGAYRGDISPLRLSGDIMRSSVETLGSTGIRGLLVPHLKLDGKKEEKPVVEEVVKSDAELAEMNRQLEELLKSMNANHPPRNEYFPEGVAESILQITNKVQADILDFKSLFGDKHQREDDEEKALQERDEKMKEEGRKQAREKQLLDLDLPASHPLEYFGVWDPALQQQLPIMPHQRRLDYFPYPVQPTSAQPQSSQVQRTPHSALHPVSLSEAMAGTAQQQIDLSELRLSDDGSVGSPFPQFDSTVLSPEAVQHRGVEGGNNNNNPKEGFAVGNTSVTAAGSAVAEPVVAPSSANVAAPTLGSAGLLSGAAPVIAGQASVDRSQVRGFGPTAGLVQSALDSEIAAVDSAYNQIRALHHQLGNRVRHLDALHGSISCPPAVPVSAYQRSAQTHFLREGTQGAGRGGIPLYARPGGVPPAALHGRAVSPSQDHHHQQHVQHAHGSYPAGLGPMAVANINYAAPVRAYSALEEYYNALAENQLAATEDTRTLFNPFPELVHSNILGVNKGIQSALDVTMRTLHARLPEQVPARTPVPPAVHPTLAEATAAAAHTVLPHPAPVTAPVTGPVTAAAAPTTAPKPSSEPALAPVVNKVATSLVEDVLNVSEYRKSAEGLLTRASPAPVAPDSSAAHSTTTVAPVPSVGAVTAATPASGLKSYLDKVQDAAPHLPATTAASTQASAPVHNPETKAPTAGAAALAAIAPGKSSREVLVELDSVLGVDDKKSNYLARDLFVPTSSANTFSAAPHVPPSAQDKPYLHAADSYLQSHYGRNTFDPRMQYDPVGQRTVRPAGANNNAPIVIQAPSDHELLHRHPQFASQGGASAPPAAVEFSMARPQPTAPVSSRLYSYSASSGAGIVPSAHVSEVHQPSGYSAYKADPRRAVELANPLPPRRPVEGGAMNYLFDNRIAVVSTEAGNKYVSPFVSPQEQTHNKSNAGYNPHYSPPAVPVARQESPPTRNNNTATREGYSESKGLPPAGYSAPNTGTKVISVPSPTSITAPHERQSYLMQMRQLRANLTAK